MRLVQEEAEEDAAVVARLAADDQVRVLSDSFSARNETELRRPREGYLSALCPTVVESHLLHHLHAGSVHERRQQDVQKQRKSLLL